jgi:hypothetical protein
VTNVVAQAKPFGKLVVTWDPGGHYYSKLLVLRTISGGGDLPAVEVDNGNEFTDTRALVKSQTYGFLIETTFDLKNFADTPSNQVVYPAWFSLRQFLPLNFDPSQGIKRLRPNDHPFVSVREIMTM